MKQRQEASEELMDKYLEEGEDGQKLKSNKVFVLVPLIMKSY
ncbi:hypothetical protein OH492_02925 [Vibrio chagasii]|nr:hypothetical protein [Vibrio chagasii]